MKNQILLFFALVCLAYESYSQDKPSYIDSVNTGSKSNFFEVYFETSRIFENEHWDINTDNIVPKSAGGKVQGYSLIKKK